MIDPAELAARLAQTPALLEELARDAPWPAGHGDPHAHAETRRAMKARATELGGMLVGIENAQRAASAREDRAEYDRLEEDLQLLRVEQQGLTDRQNAHAEVRIGLDDSRAAAIVNAPRKALGGKSYAEKWFGEKVSAADMGGAR